MKRFALIPAALVAAASLVVHAQQPPAGQTPPAGAQAPAARQQRPPEPPLGPNQWRIDTGHSQANFSVKHNVVSTVRGQLGPISGTIEYDGKDTSSVKADVTIDVTKINTQNDGRDNHLRQDDFFNVETFPTMRFVSKRAEPAGEGKFRLVGDLTIRDKTNEVVLMVEGPSPTVKTQRGIVTGATATTTISRKAFGVLWNRMIETLPVVSDEVQVTIDLQLNRPTAPGTASQ